MYNLGYACINMGLSSQPKSKRVTTNRTMIRRTFLDKDLPYASEIALQLCDGPQAALRGTKISVNNWLKSQFASLFEVSLAAELESMRHSDFSEGVNAALEKRTPKFN